MQDQITVNPDTQNPDVAITFTPTTFARPIFTTSPTSRPSFGISLVTTSPSFLSTDARIPMDTSAPFSPVVKDTMNPIMSPSPLMNEPSSNPNSNLYPSTFAPTTYPDTPLFVRITLLDFTVYLLGGQVNDTKALQTTIETYLLDTMDITNLDQVNLEQVTIRRRLQNGTLSFSYSGTVLINTTMPTVTSVQESQSRALENITAVQNAVTANDVIGTNITIDSIVVQQVGVTTPSTKNTTSNKKLYIIAGCAAGGALLLMVLICVGYRTFSKPPPPPPLETTFDRKWQTRQQELAPPPPPPLDDDDMSSFADAYSLASIELSLSTSATENEPPPRTRRSKPRPPQVTPDTESDAESAFSYDQIGLNEQHYRHGASVIDDDEPDIDPNSFFGEGASNSSILPVDAPLGKNVPSEVPSDERNNATDQDLTGFDLTNTGPGRVHSAIPDDEMQSLTMRGKESATTLQSLGTKTFAKSVRKKSEYSTMTKTINTTSSPDVAKELDSLSSFLKGRREAKRASRETA